MGAEDFEGFWREAKLGDYFVYELYGSSGDLLYVGMTRHLKHRLRQHFATKSWANEIFSASTTSGLTRSEAGKMERELIRARCPAYNVALGTTRYAEDSRRRRVPPGFRPVGWAVENWVCPIVDVRGSIVAGQVLGSYKDERGAWCIPADSPPPSGVCGGLTRAQRINIVVDLTSSKEGGGDRLLRNRLAEQYGVGANIVDRLWATFPEGLGDLRYFQETTVSP